MNIYDLPYEERKKFDITITIDAFDVIRAAERLLNDVNTDRIPYELSMSGTINVQRLAQVLAITAPRFLQQKAEGILDDYLTELDRSYDEGASAHFDEILGLSPGLANSYYFADDVHDDQTGNVTWRIISEECGPYDPAIGRTTTIVTAYPNLGLFQEESDAKATAHRWNLARDWAKKAAQRINPDPMRAPWIATYWVDWFAAGSGNSQSWKRTEFFLSWYAQESSTTDRYYYIEAINRLANVRFE